MMSGMLANIALDFVDEVLTAGDEATVRELLLDHCRVLGFEHLIICDLPIPGQDFQVQHCNWPKLLYARYRERMQAHDPIARHAGWSTEPFVWAEVDWDHNKSSPEQRVLDEAAEFGLEDGFVVPVVGVNGDQSCLALAGRRTTLEESDRRALHLMCLYAHHVVRRRHQKRGASDDRLRLTEVQRACLSYAFIGHDADAIAGRISLSADEVRRSCRDAARELHVAGPAEAAVRAAVLGEIHP